MYPHGAASPTPEKTRVITILLVIAINFWVPSIYVLESVVILDNGITLPLFSVFLNGADKTADPEMTSTEEDSITGEIKKQDCERKAFRRMTEMIKTHFRNTWISIVVDGLYA